MKVGLRIPSINKSISARTKGRITRGIRKQTRPYYGKGCVYKNPKKAVYNKVHNKTTRSIFDMFK